MNTDEWVNACFICCLPISILYFFSNRASRILQGIWLSSWWPRFPASLSSRCSHVITFWPIDVHGSMVFHLLVMLLKKKRHVCPLFSLFLLPMGKMWMWHDIWNCRLQAQDGWHLLRMAKQQDLIIPAFLMTWGYCTSPGGLVFKSLSCLEHCLGVDIYFFWWEVGVCFTSWVWLLPLEKEMAPYPSILAWRIPWTEEPGGLQSMGLQRAGRDWAPEPQQQLVT